MLLFDKYIVNEFGNWLFDIFSSVLTNFQTVTCHEPFLCYFVEFNS